MNKLPNSPPLRPFVIMIMMSPIANLYGIFAVYQMMQWAFSMWIYAIFTVSPEGKYNFYFIGKEEGRLFPQISM